MIDKPSTSSRGFRSFDRIDCEEGGQIEVYESSAAMEPHIWLAINGKTVHLTAGEAWRLRDQLDWLVANHYQGDARPADRPEVVVLCGSTRFADTFREANLRLTLDHKIVLSIGCDTKTDAELFPDGLDVIKANLDELHLRKIDMADRVLVLNVGGYIGESTAGEIAYAIAQGKPITYLERVRS